MNPWNNKLAARVAFLDLMSQREFDVGGAIDVALYRLSVPPTCNRGGFSSAVVYGLFSLG
jgi:hypothetical protein